MKHLFIVNPVAGTQKPEDKLQMCIRDSLVGAGEILEQVSEGVHAELGERLCPGLAYALRCV